MICPNLFAAGAAHCYRSRGDPQVHEVSVVRVGERQLAGDDGVQLQQLLLDRGLRPVQVSRRVHRGDADRDVLHPPAAAPHHQHLLVIQKSISWQEVCMIRQCSTIYSYFVFEV